MRLQAARKLNGIISECFARHDRQYLPRPNPALDSIKKTDLGWGVPKNSGSCAVS